MKIYHNDNVREFAILDILKEHSKTSFNESGATFNEFGEYIDYDHQQSLNELNRIPITSHVFIPPFLENLKQYLQLQISGSSIRGIGPTVNPVKDPTSELASMAKQGSFVVQNRRSKRERALQAKEAAGVENSNIGSIIDTANTTEEIKQEEKMLM